MATKPIAIRAPRMFDGERFSPGGATVLIEDGRIVGVEDGFPAVGDQFEVVDQPDSTVLPGLIDTHAHLVCDSAMGALDRVAGYSADELDTVITEGLRRQLAAGVTTVRDLGDRRFSVVDRRDRQRSGSTAAPEPTILASGPPLTSPAGHCFYLGGEVRGDAEISAAIDERSERRVDVVKVMASGGMNTAGTDVMRTQFTLSEMTLLVDRAHTAGLPVTAHAHGLPAVEQALAVGTEGIEHCSCLTDKGVQLSVELADRMAAGGVVIGGFIPVPPITDLSQAPPAIREMMERSGLTPDRVAEMRMAWLARLLGSGVRLTTGRIPGSTPSSSTGS